MSLDQGLRAFMKVAEQGSITAAADEIGMTQSALSKLVRRLEEEYGGALLHRHWRGVTVTAEGRALLRHAQAANIEIEHAREEISALRGLHKVDLKLHCGLVYALDWIHEPLRIFAERHPSVDFTIDASSYENIVPRLLEGEYDAVFGFKGAAADDRRLIFTPIHRISVQIYGRADHRFLGFQATAEELANADWCEFIDVRMTNEKTASYLSTVAGSLPRVRFKTGSLALALELVRCSDSLICLPSALVSYAAQRGLVPLALHHRIFEYETGCMIRQSSLNVDLLSELLSLIEDRVGTMDGP